MDRLLTVIIPVFNDSKHICRCLDSVLNQVIEKVEIIVVDDASTDNVNEVLYPYIESGRVKLICLEKNVGAGECRNTGMLVANTPYITFIDSDDWVDVNTYNMCLREAALEPDVICYGLVYDFVNFNHRIDKYDYRSTFYTNGEFALRMYAHTMPNEIKITPIVNNKIYRRQFLLDNNLCFSKGLRYQEDDVFTFEILSKAKTVVFVKDCKYHYCQRPNSLIHTVSEFSVDNFNNAYLELKTFLYENSIYGKYKDEYYLKFKSSLLGIIKRILDYEPDTEIQHRLLCQLLLLIANRDDISEIMQTWNFSIIRSIL